jgi:phosphotransferase system  glucose/maltose/N-acetylglucosamine-specific IIC component
LGQPDLLNIKWIADAGGAIFTNLPLIFSIGVAAGFAKENHGAAALTGPETATSSAFILHPSSFLRAFRSSVFPKTRKDAVSPSTEVRTVANKESCFSMKGSWGG